MAESYALRHAAANKSGKKAVASLALSPTLYCMSEMNMGDALKAFLNKSKIQPGLQALQITDAWETIMGKTVAKYTKKIELVNQTLFIFTDVGPLRQELGYQREKIIERVNEAMGGQVVKTVVIK
jgi:predicted nucleic acid-binding Zn ribbon protein